MTPKTPTSERWRTLGEAYDPDNYTGPVYYCAEIWSGDERVAEGHGATPDIAIERADRICAAVNRESGAVSEWRDISTAPKDGTQILGLCSGKVSVYKWDAQPFHKRPRPYWARTFHPVSYDLSWQPTHWQPFPPLPASPASGDGKGE